MIDELLRQPLLVAAGRADGDDRRGAGKPAEDSLRLVAGGAARKRGDIAVDLDHDLRLEGQAAAAAAGAAGIGLQLAPEVPARIRLLLDLHVGDQAVARGDVRGVPAVLARPGAAAGTEPV